MNISILTHMAHGGKGGIDKYVENVINAFESNRNISHIKIFSKRKIFLKKSKISLYYSKIFFFLIIRNMVNLTRSDLIFVTHINFIPYLLILIFLKKKIILFSYGLEIWGTNKNIFYRLIIKKINYFICMRNYTMNVQRKRYDIKPKNFLLLHNCISEKIKKYKLNKNQKNIITVARLTKAEKFKGVDETLQAISLIKKKKFKYYIVGEGDDLERLKNKAKSLNLSKHVIFTGYISDIKRNKLYKKSCIYSMPGSDKTFDTYPYRFSFLEAATYGLNIIASKPKKNEEKFANKYKVLNFINPTNVQEIKKLIVILLKKKKYICSKLLNDFSKNQFQKKLNKYVNLINRL